MNARFFATLALALACLLPAAGQAQTGPAGRFLQQRHEEVNRTLRRPANDDAARRRRSEQLTRLLGDLLDYDELSRRALGDHWGQHTDA
ncbi:MAG: hypothetical protein IT378_19785, partial [Sandaracinaceae bacterium]|nr:hypothetical protein [Sandaracinaceae bacterium]